MDHPFVGRRAGKTLPPACPATTIAPMQERCRGWTTGLKFEVQREFRVLRGVIDDGYNPRRAYHCGSES